MSIRKTLPTKSGGLSQTDMALIQGQLITATELNSVNSTVKIIFPTTSNDKTFYKPSEAGFFYHGSTGLIFWFNVGNGWFTSPSMTLQKLIGGTWTNVYSKSNSGWGSSWGDTVRMENTSNPGSGWYRIKFVTSKSGSSDWGYWPGQQDCVRGDYLVVWDNPESSGNRIPGISLTVEILNSGRCGTSQIV